ncbi:YggS family pyridoxal phosphate-dependent enzyme [Immundisolibacter sp.]|uniref:YggS family pyridoxal phosphate-dependent enzyme n=1 Tax=Immundisolibacter sp. TaxID=1934948 RepID=UPI00356553B9
MTSAAAANSLAPSVARWRAVQARLRAAEQRFGREAGSVGLVAVTKTQSVARIRQLAALGQRAFGENYLQEARPKLDACAGLGLEWHFIGTVQSNKAAEVARRFDWVHTVASPQQARRLAQARPAERAPLNVCLQVNADDAPGKAGVAPHDAAQLAALVASLPALRLRGLMTVPAREDAFDTQREPFRVLRRLLDDLREQGFDLDTLSMGMSGDLEAAVAEGATLVRIGTALFGPRRPKHHNDN